MDEGVNTIWVRRKMSMGVRNRVQDALIAVKSMNSGGVGEMSVNMGYQNTVLMQANILAWEGPLFRDEAGNPIPCTPQMIENMDPDDALTDAVLAKISELNLKQTGTSPNLPTVLAVSSNGSSDS